MKQNVTTIDNYAMGDSVQFMFSTDGNKIHVTNKALGWRTRQLGGHMSNGTAQKLSDDMLVKFPQNQNNAGAPPNEDVAPNPNVQTESEEGSEFKGRYGLGHTLSPGTK
jgi:hypothetical protein